MDYTLLQDIENLIISNLLCYRQLMLPDVCVLSINRYGASLTPDGNTLIPPSDHLEVYHPLSYCQLSLVDIIAQELTASDMYQAQEIYVNYINSARPDGITLTINSLAIIDTASLEVLAVSPEIQAQLNPETPQYVAPVTPQYAPPVRSYNNQKRTATHQSNEGYKITLTTLLGVAAAFYIAYYFLLRS